MPAFVSPAFRRCNDLKVLVATVVQVDPLALARLHQHKVTRDEQVHDMIVVATVKAAPPHGLDFQTRRCSGTGNPSWNFSAHVFRSSGKSVHDPCSPLGPAMHIRHTAHVNNHNIARQLLNVPASISE